MKRALLLSMVNLILTVACGHSQEVTKTPASERPNCVFMGNSITEFWYDLRESFFVEHGFVGKGIGGQTSAQMLSRFADDVIYLMPKAVTIMAGTNDIAQNQGYVSNEEIMKNITSMAEQADKAGIKVLLCSVLPAYQFGWNPSVQPVEPIKDINAKIRRYAEEKSFVYVDYYSTLVDERGGLPERYSADGVHPNVECYKIMEEIVMTAISETIDIL